MILGFSGGVIAIVVLVVLLGATMQALVGLGLNLVSAPIITLVAPSLMPELPLVLAVVLPFFTLARSHAEIDWRGLAWVLPARVPGVALGVLFLGEAINWRLVLAVILIVTGTLLAIQRPASKEEPREDKKDAALLAPAEARAPAKRV